MRTHAAGLTVTLPRGRIEVMTAAAASEVLCAPVAAEPARFVGYAVSGCDLAAQEARLGAAGVAYVRGPWGVVVPAAEAMGTAIVFVR